MSRNGLDPVLEWLCVPGREYQPVYCGGLGDGWLTELPPAEAASGQDEMSSLIQIGESQRFYRVRLVEPR